MQLDFRVYPHQTYDVCEYILFSLIRILSISVINAIIPGDRKRTGVGKDKRQLKGWKH